MSRLHFEPGSSTRYRTGDWRRERAVYADRWPSCGAGCPAGEDIQAYLALAQAGQDEAAWRKLTEHNPFPAVCGRICPHPCESACHRGALDEAVAIHRVERHLGDQAPARGWVHTAAAVAPGAPHIGIVGAGPAGLACAYHLARAGYRVTIYEAADEPGGALRWGVPDYRLPKDALAREVDAVLALGVTLQRGVRVGADITAAALRDRHDAVFVAIGAGRALSPVEADIDGHGVESGLAFLDRINRGERPDLPARVAVIGGGNTAIDVARCARRLGATTVTIVSPQDRPGRRPSMPAEEMTALPGEIVQAEAEGVSLLVRQGVQRLVRSGAHLDGLQLAQVDHVFDDAGRFRPVLFAGTEAFLPAGRVIVATGQEVDWSGLDALRPDSAAGIFVGGDCGGGARSAGPRLPRPAAPRHGHRRSPAPGLLPPDPAVPGRRGRPKHATARFSRSADRSGRRRCEDRSGALPELRRLHGLRQLLAFLPGRGGAQAGAGRSLCRRPGLLQGLRHLRGRMPDRAHPDGARSRFR